MVSLALAILALTLAVAGCGGGRGDDAGAGRYVDEVNKAQQDFAARVDELSKGITARSTAARDRQTLRSFEEAVAQVGGDLRAITPPGKVRGLHDRLVQAVDGYGEDVQRAADTLQSSRSPAQLRAAQRELSQATTAFGTTLNETIDRINRELG